MIDRENRNKLAESCRHYWSCLIDNIEFDEINFNIESDDRAVNEIKNQLWFLYDDIRVHRNSGKSKMGDSDERLLKRVIFFLKSDVEYKWINPSMIKKVREYLRRLFQGAVEVIQEDDEGVKNYWPFFSKAEYNEALVHPKYLTNTEANIELS
ncbi:MAG: hypothetical protein QNK23_06155 [Crocinitomicaceae bacterium]|nr:hypothetical protein [Crocinitomicaceae bacterium]